MQHPTEQLQRIIESARDFAVMLLDTERRVTYWNVGAERLLGWQEAEIVGQSADRIFLPEDQERGAPEREAAKAREEGRAENERWHIRKDGSRFWGSGLMQSVYEEGTLRGYVKIFRDMTERRQAEERLRESEARLRLALDASALGTFVWYVQEDRAESDARMLALFGLPADAPLSLQEALATLIHPDDRTRYAQAVACATDPTGPGVLREDIRVMLPDRTERWLNITGQTVFEGTPRRALHMNGIAADITERKRREANFTFLAEVTDAFNRQSSAPEIMQAVGEKTGAHLQITTCSFADVDEATGVLRVNHSWGKTEVPSLLQTFRIQDYLTEEFSRANRAGEILVVRDTQTDPRTDAHAYAALQIGSFVTVPFHRSGQWTAYLAVTDTRTRDWRDDEIELIQELSNRLFPRIERARAEAALQERQAEIEALNARLTRAMQETHHRVKNNLQVISAIVEMEEYNSENAAQFQRIKQHTQALAMIHDLLTAQAKGNADLSSVSAKEILGRLLPMIERSSGERRVLAKVEDVLLSVQKATSLALLVNECVSNALKHGTGDIEITLSLSEKRPPNRERRTARRARLEVCDDGSGFPAGFDPRKAAHTGLELIDSAARWDLKGRVTYENREEGGARIVITFPVTDAKTKAS